MIYLDKPQRWQGRRKNYSHMVSDKSLDELHNFAESIGVKKHWFDSKSKIPHYDLRDFEYELAVKAGAQVVSSKEIIRIMRESLLYKRTKIRK